MGQDGYQDAYHESHRDTDAFSATDKAADPVKACPITPRTLKVVWSDDEVYCADAVFVSGTATGIKSVVTGSADIRVLAYGQTAEESAVTVSKDGQTDFFIPWKVSDVFFEADTTTSLMPATVSLAAVLSADGMTARTVKTLTARRLPDKAPEAVSFKVSSPKTVNKGYDYEWTAAFRVGVDNAKIQVFQTLQIKQAWEGKWVSMDAKKDNTKQVFAFIKRNGAAWVYWNTTSTKWEALPRAIAEYKPVNNIKFIKSGTAFKSRDDGGKFTWPEAFPEPTNYDERKAQWGKNISDTWKNIFMLRVKDCTGRGLCLWNLEINVDWSDTSGDKLVYAVWAADGGRSNAIDWYLAEDRLGVAGHECGHLLGAYDEYDNHDGTLGAVDPTDVILDENTIMGQNLSGALPRHLNNMRDRVKEKISAWIGRDWDLEAIITPSS